MLAREGYTVLELAYNVPKYGQELIYYRTSPFDLSYFEEAAKRLLSHESVYGDKIGVIGTVGNWKPNWQFLVKF